MLKPLEQWSTNEKGSDHLGALQAIWPSVGVRLRARMGTSQCGLGINDCGTDVGTGEADVLEQVVVELHQVHVHAPLGRAPKHGGENTHFLVL